MSSLAQVLADDWDITELWIDPTASPPYVLVLLADKVGNCCVYDPTRNYESIFTSSTYQEAKLWLLEDEYERVEGQMKAVQVAQEE